ncbi:MAG: hypothetical protein V4649_13735 [Bacteroidota bacterium]
MASTITKNILPVVVGAMTGMMLMEVGEWGIYRLYPLPPGTDVRDQVSLAHAIGVMPLTAFLALLINYMFASFVAGGVATLVSNRLRRWPAIIVGIVLTLAGLFNAAVLPNPLWFKIANFFIYYPLAYAGYFAVRRNPAQEHKTIV